MNPAWVGEEWGSVIETVTNCCFTKARTFLSGWEMLDFKDKHCVGI